MNLTSQRHMIAVALAAAALLAAVLVAPAAATSPARRDARVSGTVQLCTGPIPAMRARPALVIPGCHPVGPPATAVVSVLGAHHHLVARQRTHAGHFSFLLAPGRYTLVAKTGGARTQRTVVARAHRTVQAPMSFPTCLGYPPATACPL